MYKYPQWAVLPLLRPYDGDLRRNHSPYVLLGDMTLASLGVANWSKRILEKQGVSCYVDIVWQE